MCACMVTMVREKKKFCIYIYKYIYVYICTYVCKSELKNIYLKFLRRLMCCCAMHTNVMAKTYL